MLLQRPLNFSTAGTSHSLPAPIPLFVTRTTSTVPFRKVTHSSHRLPRLSTSASHFSPVTSIPSQSPDGSSVSSTSRWKVLMEKPHFSGFSKSEIIDYYVETLARVVGSVRDAQMCIYDASWESDFGFCCDIDDKSSRELARTPGVLSVRPDNSPKAGKKDYRNLNPWLADDFKTDFNIPKFFSSGKDNVYWIVRMKKPGVGRVTKAQMVDYFAQTLTKVLRNEKDAQVSIYHISWEENLGFCCHIDEECAKDLSDVPGVLSVSPDLRVGSENKDYKGTPGVLSARPDDSPEAGNKDYRRLNPWLVDDFKSDFNVPKFSSSGKDNVYWIVRMEKPGVEMVTKAQMVDYYAQTLTKVLRNEKDAQVSIYHISWEEDLGFCCHIDEECAKDLIYVPGVLSVRPDLRVGSEYKDYKGNDADVAIEPSEESQTEVKTKRLFVTGLSFYTSVKTLREAFEGFGELVEVKVIMDKISKRSKGFAFLEYTTEEAAAAALKEMNGKIINGWMIVVDVAKPKEFRSVRERHWQEPGRFPYTSSDC